MLFDCGVVILFIFFRKKRSKKSVVPLKSLCFQGCSERQAHYRVINIGGFATVKGIYENCYNGGDA